MSNNTTTDTCGKCNGKGFIPTRGYRFYSLNATFCPCGAFPTLRDACNAEDARRTAAIAAAAAAYTAERNAARAARRAARAGETEVLP